MNIYATPHKTAYFLLFALTLFSTAYNAFLPLHGDEAYYWVWSHHLQGGYFDHAPLIAYMIALSNFISESEWGVRLSATISMGIAGLYLFKLTEKISNAKTALNALLIFCSVILVHAGFTIVTPDAPLILFWTLSLYYGYIALFENRTSAFVLLGVCLGLMMLGKYSAILFVFFLLLFALFKARERFRDWRVYMVIVISFLIVTPMLWWNYQNEWISFMFQLGHGTKHDTGVDFGRFLEFFGGQFGIFTPVFTAMLFYYFYKYRLFFHDKTRFYLALSALVPLLFFFYKSFISDMQLNYTAPAYISAAILLAVVIEKEHAPKLFKIALGVALVMTLLVRIAFITHLEIIQDRMYGNREAIALLERHLKPSDAVYGDHLTIAALLTYYLPEHPKTDVPTASRFSQYDMWRAKTPFKDGLYLGYRDRLKKLQKVFLHVEELETLSVKRGVDRTKTFHIYRVSGAKASF